MTEPAPGETPPEQTPAPAGGTPPKGGGVKTFNQEDVDRFIEQRLAREKSKYSDYDALKAAADELKKIKDEQLSEAERQKKALDEANAIKAGLEAQLKAKEIETQGLLIRAEVRVVATGMGFASPEDAYALADLEAVKVSEAGVISGVKEALDVLSKAKPYLLSKQHPGDVGTPRRGSQGAPPKPAGTPPEQERPLATL